MPLEKRFSYAWRFICSKLTSDWDLSVTGESSSICCGGSSSRLSLQHITDLTLELSLNESSESDSHSSRLCITWLPPSSWLSWQPTVTGLWSEKLVWLEWPSLFLSLELFSMDRSLRCLLVILWISGITYRNLLMHLFLSSCKNQWPCFMDLIDQSTKYFWGKLQTYIFV